MGIRSGRGSKRAASAARDGKGQLRGWKGPRGNSCVNACMQRTDDNKPRRGLSDGGSFNAGKPLFEKEGLA